MARIPYHSFLWVQSSPPLSSQHSQQQDRGSRERIMGIQISCLPSPSLCLNRSSHPIVYLIRQMQLALSILWYCLKKWRYKRKLIWNWWLEWEKLILVTWRMPNWFLLEEQIRHISPLTQIRSNSPHRLRPCSRYGNRRNTILTTPHPLRTCSHPSSSL